MFRTRFSLLVTLATLVLPTVAVAQTREDQLVHSSQALLNEIMAIPAKQIPESLMSKAQGIAIIPNVVKGGFVVGIRHGRGVVLTRDEAGVWQPPMFVSLTGGSVGWQAGIQATDVILVFRTRKSLNGLMKGKVTIGVDAAAAAGPVGRKVSAATDVRLQAEILSYSRSRGLFAGVSLDGSAIVLDHGAGYSYYGGPIFSANGQRIGNQVTIPASGVRLINQLQRYAGGAQVAAPPATRAPGSLAPSPRPAHNHDEFVRGQLVASWRQLTRLLDDEWQKYLALPKEVVDQSGPVQTASLNRLLQHYTSAMSERRYDSLTRRPEFTTTHQLLREYLTLQVAEQKQLTLPPPPPAAAHPKRRY